MIRDVAELRERGQLCRRVADLDIDVQVWRAGMRRAARREGMRIRTFVVVDPSDPEHSDGHDDLDPPGTPGPDALVYVVRTDLPPPGPAAVAAAIDRLPAPPGYRDAKQHAPAPVTSLTDARARRSGHPCTDPHPDRG